MYDVDGLYLDGTMRWDNCPDYSPYEGLVEWVKEMEKRNPDKLMMGEDGYVLRPQQKMAGEESTKRLGTAIKL